MNEPSQTPSLNSWDSPLRLRTFGGVLASIVFAVSCGLLYYVDSLWMQDHIQRDKANLAKRISDKGGQLAAAVNIRLLLIRGLEAAIRTDPALAEKNFDSVAKALIGNLSGILSLQLAPNGVVTHVTNPERNKTAIGHDLFKNPKRKALVEEAKDKRKYVIEGPTKLIQGGEAIIARLPIFVPEKSGKGETFWGFATVLIDVSALLEEAGIKESIEGVAMAVRGKDAVGASGEVFFGKPDVFRDADALFEIRLPVGSWQLGAKRTSGLPDLPQRLWLWLFGGTIALLLSWAIFAELIKRERLKQEIRNATADAVSVNDSLKLERDRLELALTGSRLSLWESNLRTGEVSFDKHWGEWMGETPHTRIVTVDELLGRVPGEHRNRMQALALEIAQGRRSNYEVEHQYRTGTGELRWIHGRGKVIAWDEDGRPTRMIGTNEDITERKRDEEKLQIAREEADAANEAKSVFLAKMSHEIRTPMNGVIGMIEVLEQSGPLQQRQKEVLRLARESAFSLLHVIDDILDFSKIEAGALKIEVSRMQPEQEVEHLCETFAGMAEAKAVELTLFTDPTLPKEVKGDAFRLRQVLGNLVQNAIKFTGGQERPAKVSLRASVVEQDENGVTVDFQVADNGIGIDKETQSQLFQPFSQADASTTRRFGGSGLGLAICLELVKLMGGNITVQSTLGKGAVFTVRLPFEILPQKSVPSDADTLVSGLSCVLVGEPNSFTDDLAHYLTNGGAKVERIPELATARERSSAWPAGLWVAVIDAANNDPSLEALRTTFPDGTDRQYRFVVVGRRRRTTPRRAAPNLVVVDRNVLGRRGFLGAVAMAVGRIQPISHAGEREDSTFRHDVPDRANALRDGRLVLVAEDNEINQKVVVRQLALLGYSADVAYNGREAFDRWRSGDYRLVLSDLHMPEMDGYQLAAAIRAAETGSARTPIIALTANALRGEAEKCRAAGMDDYLSKPVSLENLRNSLEKWLPTAKSVSRSITASPSQSPATMEVNVLKSLVGDDPAIVSRLLRDFHASAVETAAILIESYKNGHAAQAGLAAHKLKSSARSVGAIKLGELCAEIEQAGKAGESETLAALMPRFEAEMAAVEKYLRGLQDVFPASSSTAGKDSHA